MILREHLEGGSVAAEALLWLRRLRAPHWRGSPATPLLCSSLGCRNLHFLANFFERVADSARAAPDLAPMMKLAYSETLEPHHGWLGTQLINASHPALPVSMAGQSALFPQITAQFAPNRAALLHALALGRSQRDAQVLRELRQYQQRMRACLQRLAQFYAQHRLEDPVAQQ